MRATGGGEADERYFLFDGSVYAAHKALAHDRAHRAAHEVEFKTGHHHIDVVHCTAHDHQGVCFAGVLHGFFEALGVLAAVFEFQGVHRQHFLTDFVAAFGVEEHVQTIAGAHAVVVAASRADVVVGLQVALVEHGFATGALDPHTFGHATALRRFGVLNFGGSSFSSQLMVSLSSVLLELIDFNGRGSL